jgi:hypothetical protein
MFSSCINGSRSAAVLPHSDPRYRDFYDRYVRGEKLVPSWVNPSDFEKLPPE